MERSPFESPDDEGLCPVVGGPMDGALVAFDIESGWFIFGPLRFASHVYAMIGTKYGYAGAREHGDRSMITEQEIAMAGRVLGMVR